MMVSLLLEADAAVGLLRAAVDPEGFEPVEKIECVEPNHTQLVGLLDMDELMLKERRAGALLAYKDKGPERDRGDGHKERKKARNTTLVDDLGLHAGNP